MYHNNSALTSGTLFCSTCLDFLKVNNRFSNFPNGISMNNAINMAEIYVINVIPINVCN